MKYSILAMIYIILLDALVFLGFTMRQNEVLYEQQQRQQDIQVNYATDAATWMMLNETPDIDIDYTNISTIVLSPEVALNTYEAMMVRGLGWSDEKATRQVFEDAYMPFFIVAVYDGYYIYGVVYDIDDFKGTRVEGIENVIYPKMWTPKIPFAEEEPGTTGGINIYTLGTDSYIRYDYGTSSYRTLMYTENSRYVAKPGDINKSYQNDMVPFVSSELTEAANKALYIAKAQFSTEKIFIPSSYSNWGSNQPIDHPTVLAYMDTNGNNTRYSHVSFAIGGTRITEADYYIAYYHNGKPLYTKVANRKKVEAAGIDAGTETEIYTSAIEAALNGYYYDIRYLY